MLSSPFTLLFKERNDTGILNNLVPTKNYKILKKNIMMLFKHITGSIKTVVVTQV